MIISFLKSLYYPHIRIMYLEEQYRQLLADINRSSIGSHVYHLLKSGGRVLDVPHFVRERLYGIYEACFFQNLLIKHETELLLRHFEASAVPVIPLKGTIMAERYFGHFAARGTSDVDLLVRREHMEKAVECVQRAGFATLLEENPVHYHNEWIKTSSGLTEPLAVELHWSLVPSGSSRIDMETAWECSGPLPGYENVRVLSAAYTFYSLCLHGASHHMDSMKYIVDLLHFIERYPERIDFEWMMQLADHDRTRGRITAALSVVYSLFPELNVTKPLPFQPKVRFWSDRVFQPGGNGSCGRMRILRALFALSILDTWRYRLIHLFRLLIPSGDLLRYSLDNDSRQHSLPVLYYRLYKQRLRKLFGNMRRTANISEK